MGLVVVVSFVLIVLVDVAATSSDNPFTCEAGNFSSGEPAALTCHFGPNIYNDGYHFEIMRYAFDNLDSDTGDTVLQCHWIGNAHQCKTKSGFNFDGLVQENVTLTIPQVKLEFAGRYACQLIPLDERTPRLCDLHVYESSRKTGLAEDVCNSQTRTTALYIFGALLILCIIVIVYLLCRMLKKTPKYKAVTAKYMQRTKRRQNKKDMFVEDEDARLGTFTMPTILPVEKMEDNEKIEQAPPPYTKLPESTSRRPTWML